MGCTQSNAVASGAHSPAPPSDKANATSPLLHPSSDEPSLPLEQQQTGWDDFTKHYKVVKHITGGAVGSGLSNFYVVVKHGEAELDETTEAVSDDTEEDRLYIMQAIDIKSVAPERRKAIKKEIHSLKHIQHPNILRVYDVFDATRRDNTISTVTEMCTGQHLHATNPYPELRVRTIVTQLLSALAYMHKRGLFHNNLTTENILFQDDSQDAIFKITYAGVASSAHSGNNRTVMSPDWDEQGRDIYSVGMIAYKLMSGGKEPPTDMDTQLVAPGTNLFLGRRWKLIQVSRYAKQFMEQCLQSDSTKQMTVEQAMRHPWITQERTHRVVVAPNMDPSKALVPVAPIVPVSLSTEQYNLDVKSRIDNENGLPQVLLEREEPPIEAHPSMDAAAGLDVVQSNVGDTRDTLILPTLPSDPAVTDREDDLNSHSSVEENGNVTEAKAGLTAPDNVVEETLFLSTIASIDEPLLYTTTHSEDDNDDAAVSDSASQEPEAATSRLPLATSYTGDDGDDGDDGEGLPIETILENNGRVETEPKSVAIVDQDGAAEQTEKVGGHGEVPTPETVCEDLPPVSETIRQEEQEALPSNVDTDTEVTTTVDTTAAVETFVARDASQTSIPDEETTAISTPAEFLDFQEIFQQAESEQGGDMTVESLKAKFRTKYTEEEVNAWFHGGNFDDTSNLRYTELLATVIKSRRTIEVRRIKHAFQAIDKGKRGFVTVGNLRAVLGSNNNENTEMLIKAADSKRDGRISYGNFAQVVKQWAGEDLTE